MRTVSDIRTSFLDYFAKNDHKIIPSSPLVPQNDPTLMFANAGMNQFKNVFTGQERPLAPRATSSQKCVRAGGKHNDLDNVGYTARHHTFFEMLGNFSFGDYFKEQAIVHAWTLLTGEFGLPTEKLGVTVYHTDDEAFDLWRKIGVAENKILRIPTSDNFWAMGDTGPCGPCSEIFYDHGESAAVGSWSLDADGNDRFGDRFIEIWNLVFMQFDQIDKDTRVPLPKPCIDTGMGLERLAAVLQGVHDNYDIDLFRKLIDSSASLTGTPDEGAHRPSHKVVADHLRSSCFLIADGVLPSNEGRGYVLRRILRRAMRHLHLLGAREPVMHRLVPTLVAEMGTAYSELGRAQPLITETLKLEEERFRGMLDRGLRMLEDERAQMKNKILPGESAFKLYDTFGFPLDLTQDILRGHGESVDEAGFAQAMEVQRANARAAWKGSGGKAVTDLWFRLGETVPATEFLGYHSHRASGEALALVKDGSLIDSATAGDTVLLVVNQTPFYGESGGQVGDTGRLEVNGKMVGSVEDTTKPHPDFFAHRIALTAPLKKGDTVELIVDDSRRSRIRANHSATHLLHAALRKFLGHHVTQKGSLVGPDRLRFDFSHPKGLSAEEWRTIETEVNRHVWENRPVGTRLMGQQEAIAEGAMALFGEKYADEVRVLNVGLGDDEKHFSIELCGGIHVERTGDIGLFKILSEAAVAAGVRRIEAVTREGAFGYLTEQENQLKDIAGSLKTSPSDLPSRVETMAASLKRLEREVADAKKKLALGGESQKGETAVETVAGLSFIARHFEEMPPKELRGLAEGFLKGRESSITVVTSAFEGKGSLVIAATPDLAGRIDAAQLVRLAVPVMGGQGGGGKAGMAQGGGPDASKSSDVFAAVKAALA